MRARLRAISSSFWEFFSHFGVGWERCFLRGSSGVPARRARCFFMFGLLGERDGRLFAADADLQSRPARVDGEVLVAQPAHQVEGLARRLLARHAQRIGRHRRLDRRAHLGRRAEEAIGGGQALEPLVRALEVVVLHEERPSSLAVVEVGEHRPGQELLPHRLPEALDLAAGLWVVGPALHVRDAVSPELLLERGRAPPRRVLAPLVGEDLARGAVVGDGARECFHHERALLVMRHHQAHEITRVIVHEGGDIDALVAAQQEREEIRLPQLVGLGALEALGVGFRTRPGGRRFAPSRQALFLQHPAHRRLRRAHAEETLHHVTNAPAARLRLRALDRHHGLAPRVRLGVHRASLAAAHRPRLQGSRATRPVFLHPFVQRGVGDSKLLGHPLRPEVFIHHHGCRRHHHVDRPCPAHLAARGVLADLLASI
jgi:hypothetical protein